MKIDLKFIQDIKNTCDRIGDAGVKKIVVTLINSVEQDLTSYNQDCDDSISNDIKNLKDKLKSIIDLINNKTAEIKKYTKADADSERKAEAILKKITKIIDSKITELEKLPVTTTPSSVSTTSRMFVDLRINHDERYWQENRLRLEQQLLIGTSELSQEYLQTLGQIKEFAEQQRRYPKEIFICYAWPDNKNEDDQHLKWIQPFLVNLRTHLHTAGFVRTLLDIKDNSPGGNIIEYMKKSKTAAFVLLIGTPTLLRKHEQGLSAVAHELNNLNEKRVHDHQEGKHRVFPLLLSGEYDQSFPINYKLYSTIKDWKGTKTYYQHLHWLICALYDVHENYFDNQWNDFLSQLEVPQKDIFSNGLSKDNVLQKLETERRKSRQKQKNQKEAEKNLLDMELMTSDKSSSSNAESDDPDKELLIEREAERIRTSVSALHRRGSIVVPPKSADDDNDPIPKTSLNNLNTQQKDVKVKVMSNAVVNDPKFIVLVENYLNENRRDIYGISLIYWLEKEEKNHYLYECEVRDEKRVRADGLDFASPLGWKCCCSDLGRDLSKAIFDYCDFKAVKFNHCNLENASFKKANLENADFSYVKNISIEGLVDISCNINTIKCDDRENKLILELVQEARIRRMFKKLLRLVIEFLKAKSNTSESMQQVNINGLSHQASSGKDHCLLEAIAGSLGAKEKEVRKFVIDAIQKDSYANKILEELISCLLPTTNLVNHVSNMKVSKSHDVIDLIAIMLCYERPIIVIGENKLNMNNYVLECFNGKPIFVFYKYPGRYDGLVLNKDYDHEDILRELQPLKEETCDLISGLSRK
jgi:hypothetical protein